MGRGRSAAQWAVAVFAAYCLFLQSLVMADAMAARAGETDGGFAVLCSGTMILDISEDGAPVVRGAAPCALCGLGHAALDVPRFVLPLPLNIVETVAAVPAPPTLHAPPRARTEARPRAPPAFV